MITSINFESGSENQNLQIVIVFVDNFSQKIRVDSRKMHFVRTSQETAVVTAG
jgi:hypothetical protein